MKFSRFARTFCWNIGRFGANLCELFPDLRIRHSKIGQETSKLGARMNRLTVTCPLILGIFCCKEFDMPFADYLNYES